MPKNIIVSKGNINYILKLSIVHHEEHYFLLRFARISFTRSFTFHFIVKIKLSRGRKNRIRCSWREKKKRERKKGKNSSTGWIPISRIFFVRCTYTRVQRLSLMGWVSWTRTCCYKLIFLARNEFSLSTSTNYSRSIIGIWKRVLIYIYI